MEGQKTDYCQRFTARLLEPSLHTGSERIHNVAAADCCKAEQLCNGKSTLSWVSEGWKMVAGA